MRKIIAMTAIVVTAFGLAACHKNDSGNLKDIGEWQESYDGNITRIELDLSSLADKSVRLVLIVDANGKSKEDAAFWLNPHIQRP